MKLYYKAIGKDGKFVQGIIEAKDPSQAAGYLRSKEFVPVRISKQEKNKFLESIPIIGHRASSRDILIFTRQLSAMLSAGLTLIKSLDILKDQLNKGLMSEVIDGIISDIEEGESFSSAISKFPKVFSPIYVSMIKASESSGLLDKALSRFADDLEKEQRLNSTVKGALLYPAIVVAGMVAVAAIMMIFVMPTLSELYKSFPDAQLPLPTQIVIGVSNFTVKFWPVPVIFLVLISLFFRRWRRTEAGRLIFDSLILKLPIFGTLIRKLILTKLSRTLGLLVGTGTLVVQSLEQVADVTGNIHYKNAIVDVSKRVEKGESMGDAMSHYALFPPVLIQLIKSGEQTGKIDEILVKASEYFEGEVDETVKTLTTAMEPAIMVILGIGVAFLVISVLTPIYSLISSF
ncbi:MAG: hypothetical protein A3D74_03785 [Candidatus Levybacteria bacterium RIFCSPHIGHO2_02_FULL_37_13]|nr:MAG: hypothetical protein A3D74_03785 [Candidatus Levybacteria bacterium RIFCSPHIGHO2_02_FULL_37_13]OGH29017.1 MAG: hypothetical protein A3E40_00505 [Candidatus Levybacteria bacterium RIFCSPHIGHO2_12_FULL_37_9]OGH37362.1 MAG: hypothetical protein A3B41_01670 [Candidatus Levybacteria bacterium RIFCSPLOWO2_01_FULL_37_26]